MAVHRLVAELHAARLRSGRSRAQVVEHLGCSESAIGAWERGDSEPGLERLDGWAALHGLRLGLTPVEVQSPLSEGVEELLLAAQTRAMCVSGEARRIREAAGVTQREVARALKVDHKTVHRWDSGQVAPTSRVVIAYGRLLEALRRQVAS